MTASHTDYSQKSTPELIAENARLSEEVILLKKKLEQLQAPVGAQNVFSKTPVAPLLKCAESSSRQSKITWQGKDHNLSKEQVERYSRQILLNSMGVQGLFSLP